MLFRFAHTHTLQDCPAFNPGSMVKMQQLLNSAGAEGVRIRATYLAPVEHCLYGLVEADGAEAVHAWLRSVRDIGEATVHAEHSYPSHLFFSFDEGFLIFHPASDAKASLEHHLARCGHPV
jgi:hypothetical protein